MIQSNVSNIIDSLKCQICLDVVTLPVHGKCCVNSKMSKPACLACVRNYLQLNIPISNREALFKKSWTGCGCELPIKSKVQASYFYEHTNEKYIYGKTHYGNSFGSVIGIDNGRILGVQFHPEKSHSFGIEFFENYLNFLNYA